MAGFVFGPYFGGNNHNLEEMTQAQLIERFGNPMTNRAGFERKHMTMLDLYKWDRVIEPLPSRVYLNRLMVVPLTKVLDDLLFTGLHSEIKTWDGCYNVRYMRGSRTMLSRHSWGLAIDLNAAWNPLVRVTPANRAEMRKKYVKWSDRFLHVWRKNGFDCGADWKNSLDGMHFELKVL